MILEDKLKEGRRSYKRSWIYDVRSAFVFVVFVPFFWLFPFLHYICRQERSKKNDTFQQKICEGFCSRK